MSPTRQKLIRKAERLVGRGKLNAAIDEYLAVLEAHPGDTTTLNRVGDLYARLQRLDEAIELFKRAAERFSDEGFSVKAIAIYRKILRLDPLQLVASESLADLQARQGLLQDARQQYLSVADGYQRRGDKASVTAVHRKLVDLEPDDPSHRLHLAELLKEQDQIQEAQGQYGAIAELLLAHGKVEDALTVCREAFELDHDGLDFVTSVVTELQRAGYAHEADQFLSFAAEKNPEVARIQMTPAESQFEVEEPPRLDVEREPETVPEIEPEAPEDTEFILDLDKETPEDLELLVGDEEPAALDEAATLEEVEEVQEIEVEPEAEEVYELDLDEEEEIEFELEDFEPVVATEPPVDQVPLAAESAGPQVEESVGEIEGLRELLIEAEVLARYGLEGKAAEKYEEVIRQAPRDLDSHRKLITIYLEHQKSDRVADLAAVCFDLAKELGQDAQWTGLQEELTDAGFTVAGRDVTPPLAAPLIEEQPVQLEEPAGAELEDISWLEESPAQAAGEKSESAVFESEAEFFDLATEIERELDQEDLLPSADLVASPEEQSLEEIVEGFKKGMAATLSAEDYDTHYNLGIAYREMGLIDEAISEFQLAAKDHRYLVDCCSLLASCFVDKGFPELAVKWYNEGLSSPIITEEETLGLVYELGNLYLSMGETEEARLRFVEIFGVNSDYRDVGTKLADLEQA